MNKAKTFWNWFQDNQQTIYNLQTETAKNRKHITFWLTKHLTYYSKGVDFAIAFPKKPNKPATLTITANGDPNYFKAVTDLIDQAPVIKQWKFEAFIKPTKDLEVFYEGRDNPFIFQDITLKVSEAKFLPVNYDEKAKKFDIIVYLKNYNIKCNTHNWKEAVHIILQQLFGEKYIYQHLDFVQLAQYPEDDSDLLELCLFDTYIDHLRSELGRE